MKTEIRKKLLAKRKSLSSTDIKSWSSLITQKLKELPIILNADRIHVYYPINNEVDIRPFIEWLWEKEKKVIMPRANFVTKEMDNYYVINFGQLEKTRFGLMEPSTVSPLHLGSPDIIIVPGVAFGKDGSRMGYGGGFYDRFLKDSNSVSIGAAYDMQILPSLPQETHDRKLDMVVTEKGVFSSKL